MLAYDSRKVSYKIEPNAATIWASFLTTNFVNLIFYFPDTKHLSRKWLTIIISNILILILS